MGLLDNFKYSKNPSLFIVITIFIILNMMDIITALFILPGEANPIYIATGSMFPILCGKIFVCVIAIWIYKQNRFPTQFQYFMILSFLILGNLLLILGVASNVYGIFNPQVIEASAQVPVSEKISFYWQLSFLFYFLPLAINLIVFKIWEKSIKCVIIKKEETKVWRKMKQWLKISQEKQ